MTKKVQIWLRLDQAECVIEALDYAEMQCRMVSGDSSIHNPNRVLARNLATARIGEVSAVVNEAVAKVQP